MQSIPGLDLEAFINCDQSTRHAPEYKGAGWARYKPPPTRNGSLAARLSHEGRFF